ncbi:LicD family [Phytophthora cactorum]|nr:LicD family [Phytophthora cactorum]
MYRSIHKACFIIVFFAHVHVNLRSSTIVDTMVLLRREVKFALIVASQLLLFGLFLLYAPRHEGGLLSDRLPSSNSLRRCISSAHRDARYVKPGMCVTTDQRLHALEDLVYALKVMLENANVVYWIDSGTLLGVYRARQLVPWDYNADMGLRSLWDQNRPRSGSDACTVRRGEDEDSEVTRAPNATVVKHFRVPRDWIFPLRLCKLELFEVMCPAQMAPYLMFIFGNRFLTPELWE